MLLLKCIGNPLWIRLCFGYRLLRVQLQAHCRMQKVAKTYAAEQGPSRFELFCFSVPFSNHFPLQLSWVLFLLFSCILHVRALFSWSCFSLHSNLSPLEELYSFLRCILQYVWGQLSRLLFLSIIHAVLLCVRMSACDCLLAHLTCLLTLFLGSIERRSLNGNIYGVLFNLCGSQVLKGIIS